MTFGRQFLHDPELFPARLAGEVWGEHESTLPLAGTAYRVTGLTETQQRSLADRYGELTGDGAPFTITVYRAPATDFLAIDTRGWEYTLDIDATDTTLSIAGMRLMARVDLSRARAAIWTPVDAFDEFWGIVENVLRPLVAVRLLATGGLLVHSSAVALDGAGFLFAGRSGAGKSTVAQLALQANHPVLSDDLNAVVRDGERFVLAPIPFTGDLTREEISGDAAPLTTLVKLAKGDAESIAPLPRGEAVSLLIAAAPYVNRDERYATQLLDRAAEIAASTRRVILTFRRDGDVWPILSAIP